MLRHRLGGRFVTPLIMAVVVGFGLLFLVAFRPAKELNVILITVDTLRADHLGVYGYARNTSPNVDRFAKESILFRRAFSHASQTNPSFSSLMTSHYPHETKVFNNFYLLLPGAVTMAEILKANRYHTAAINSHFSLRRGSGFEQGFDEYDDRLEDLIRGRRERLAPKTTLAAIRWLEDNYKKRFFLWVHYDDPHGPYAPPPPFNTMFVEPSTLGKRTVPIGQSSKGEIPSYQQLGKHRDPEYYISQYDGEIRFFDDAFGVLIQRILELGLLNNSLIIFTADHGEGMGEHEYYFAHGQYLYNGLIHVPLIIRLPGQSSEPKEIRYPVAHVDLLPTILDAASINHPNAFKGRNLLTRRENREIFSETHTQGGGSKYALIANGMKLMQDTSHYELYDLEKDIAETVNLMAAKMSSTVAAKVADLKRELEAIRQQDSLALGSPIFQASDEQTKKKLRALGYVQ